MQNALNEIKSFFNQNRLMELHQESKNVAVQQVNWPYFVISRTQFKQNHASLTIPMLRNLL